MDQQCLTEENRLLKPTRRENPFNVTGRNRGFAPAEVAAVFFDLLRGHPRKAQHGLPRFEHHGKFVRHNFRREIGVYQDAA